jgi:Peptidase inhibitor family I36
MKPRALVAVTVLGIWMMGVPALAQQGRDQNNSNNNRDGDRVCFFRDVQFEGPSWCYRPGDELADLRDRGNEISSIRISGRARVVVYDLDEFMGVADEFDMDVADLRLRSMERRRDWNDRIDSFQVVGRRRGGPFGVFGRNDRDDRDDRDNRPARDRICVYEEPNYSGRSQCWTVDEDVNNLSGTGWNDRISSVRVFGRAHVELYRDSNYRGGRIRLDRDAPDLGPMNWGDQISSFQVR